jgi:hypothetical protein
MSYSYTNTNTFAFTITHARYLSSKVAADMHLCALYYGKPSEDSIRAYAEELAQNLKEGYVAQYEFGYKKVGKRIVSWQYVVDEYGRITVDDRPGKVVPYVDVAGAVFFNYIWHSPKFHALSQQEQDRFEGTLPFSRTAGSPPFDGLGYWTSDKNYFSGKGLSRQTFQPIA